jgi:hypothetical protein
LERIGSDAVEIWIDSNSEPYLLANLTRRGLGEQVLYGNWWNLSSSNAAFSFWASAHNSTVLLTAEKGRVLAEDFLVYLRSLKQLVTVVV